MANSKASEKMSFRAGLMQKLTLAPEARNEPSKGPYPAGRIKKFFDIIRSHFSQLSMVNVLCIIFALPLIAVIAFVSVYGIESFTYLLNKSEIPYLLNNFGIGLSNGTSLTAVKLEMLLSYRIIYLAAAATMPILSFGLAGAFYIVTKLVWGESFICKKDKYGNNVPRIGVEFFRGVKLYWKQMLVFVSVAAVIFAASANMVITFIGALWAGNAGALHYIGLIFACILTLFTAMVLVTLLPSVVSYKTRIRDKIKNSVLFTIAFPVPTFFILAIAAAPLLLMLASGILVFILTLFIIMLGISILALMFTNYADYNSEKILVPLYQMTLEDNKKVKKASKNNQKKRK